MGIDPNGWLGSRTLITNVRAGLTRSKNVLETSNGHARLKLRMAANYVKNSFDAHPGHTVEVYAVLKKLGAVQMKKFDVCMQQKNAH